MSSKLLCVVIVLACALKFGATQTSCKGRCGAEYYRGYMCQCDYTCLTYKECCKDFESQCTTENSCKGRCGETFRRGRQCSCDPDCVKYKQCCADYKTHCDAEEINLNEATEPSIFSEANDADISNKISTEELSNSGVEDPQVNPILESSSGYEPFTADLLGQVSTEPTVAADTLQFSTEMATALSQTEMTPTDDNVLTLYTTAAEVPAESTDASDPTSSPDLGTTTPPQPTTAADPDPSQSTSALATQTEPSTSASTPELGTVEQLEIQPTDDSSPSDEPEVTTVPSNTQESSTVLEDSQVTTSIPASSTLDSTAIPEETTSDPNTETNTGDVTTAIPEETTSDPHTETNTGDVITAIPEETTSDPHTETNTGDVTTGPPSLLEDPEDPSTSVSPAVTTRIPSSTAADQDVTPEVTSDDLLKVPAKPTTPQISEPTSKPQDKPDPYKPDKPISKPDTKPPETEQTFNNIDDTKDYQADDSNDTNLCSGRPISGVTTLRNGTIAVFRGHYFWFLDRNRVPGPARGITQVWGVPSPIDTVFTRCNCQGKTYILKGSRYWRFDNDVLDPGYPRVTQTGFDGLQGHITAALSVPQHRSRREAVYFFKRGGFVQKYSYQFGTSPTCGRRVQNVVYTVRTRTARQAVSVLEPAVNIRTSWRGFPSTITAAVSIPSSSEPEGYKYYVFSRSKSYNVRMDSGRPVISPPAANTSPQTDNIFKCPKKV